MPKPTIRKIDQYFPSMGLLPRTSRRAPPSQRSAAHMNEENTGVVAAQSGTSTVLALNFRA